MAAPKKRIASAAVDSDLDRRIDLLASKMGLTRSAVLEKIIRNGVNDLETATKVIGVPGLNALFRLSLAFENEEDAEHLRYVLNSIREHRKGARQQSLPFGELEAG